MTLEGLNEYLDLMQRLQRNRETLASLEARAVPGAQVITGMPHAPGVSTKVEMFALEIADFKDRTQALEKEIAQRRPEVEAFIQTVTPDWLRLALRLRFLYAMQWKEVGYMLGYTEETICRMCYRYLRGPAMSDDVQ